MNDDLKKYTDELSQVEKAILQVEGMINTKTELVQDLQSQLGDLESKKELIEKVINEKEKEQQNEMNQDEEEKKAEEQSEFEPEEKEPENFEEELYDKPNASGLKIENLDKGLMDTMVNAKKSRNNSILQEMKNQAKARAELMPEQEVEIHALNKEEKKQTTPIVEKEDLEL